MIPAIFIDRDGVINKEVKHPEIKDAQGRSCSDPLSKHELIFFDQVEDAFKLFKDNNLFTCIVSNQAGFAKGFFSEDILNEVKTKLKEELSPSEIYYCTHHEDYTGPCDCKKPKKGMLKKAESEHNVDISKSYMIGDRRNDMIFGDECKHCYMVASREGEDPEENKAMLPEDLQKKVTIVKSLYEAAELIIEDIKNNS